MLFKFLLLADRSIFDKNWKKIFSRFKFWGALIIHFRNVAKLISRKAPASWLKTVHMRPESLGVLIWPYMSNTWGVEKRVSALLSHHQVVTSISSLNIDVDQAVTILQLGHVFPGLSVVMDRPKWFMREGELSLNLFLGGERIYSIAFCLANDHSRRIAYIGGIQGRNIPEIMSLYHDLTKAMHGCRPRDFLTHVFFDFCNNYSVDAIYAVSEAYRHHRHHYFGASHKSANSSNYDEIWTERGGELGNDGFFKFSPNQRMRKDIAEISVKKRAMYKRRYELLDEISKQTVSLMRD